MKTGNIEENHILAKITGRVNPHIYAFRTNSVPDSMKVGDTLRGVSKRLDEWRSYYPNLVKMYDHIAIIPRHELYFRDYAVHQYLEKEKRLPRLGRGDFAKGLYYSHEFFRGARVNDLEEAIEDIAEDADNGRKKYQFYDYRGLPMKEEIQRSEEPWMIRNNQQVVVKNFLQAVKKHRDNLLMYAVMRFGKTFTALSCAEKMKARFVLVVSAKGDVMNEWKDNVLIPKQFSDFVFLTQKDLRESDNIISDTLGSGKVAVVFLTLQDLQGDIIKEKHSEIFRHEADLLVIDETHFGARADEYGKVLRQSPKANSDESEVQLIKEEDEHVLKELRAKVRLHLSGTPYNILVGNEFTKDDIIAFCQYSDIQREKEKWYSENIDRDEWENPYYGFPQMIRFAFTPSESAKQLLQKFKSEGVKYDFSELFSTLSTKRENGNDNHRKFRHQDEVLELMQTIDGSKTDPNVLSFLDLPQIKKGEMCHHIVCALPYRSSCDALSKLLADKKETFKNLGNYHVVNIAGHDSPFKKIEDIKRHISKKEEQGEKTISLTVNRMLTGCTVPEWDTMIFLKATKSAQEYDQAGFRIQSQYIKEFRNENGDVIKRDMKPQTLLVDFDPDRMFRIQERRAFVASIFDGKKGLDEITKRINEDMRFSPIITLNANRLSEVTANDVITSVIEYSRMRSASNEAMDLPIDYSVLTVPEISEFVISQNEIDSKKGWNMEAHKRKDGDPSDLDSTGLPSVEGKAATPKDKLSENNKEKEKSIEKQFATLYVRILFFAYLSDSEITSFRKLIEVSEANKDNIRILRNLGLPVKILKLLEKKMDVYKLRSLDNSIQLINRQIKDDTIPVEVRIANATRKFGRMSSAEIITPENIASDMVDLLPKEAFKKRKTPVILDIAAKQGEFAYALYKKYGDRIKKSVYSLPTSPLAYEFTRKIYKLLGFPVKNVISDFNSFDLIGTEKDKYINRLKEMNLNIIIGNPPYQKMGGSGGTNDAPIFQCFCDIAFNISNICNSFIIPAKWFSGGRENLLGAFRKFMLSCGKVKSLFAFPNGRDLFPDVEIKGGLCYFLIDKNYHGDCTYRLTQDNVRSEESINLGAFDIMIRDPKLRSIIEKIQKIHEDDKSGTVDNIISADTPFGIPSNPGKSSKTPFYVSSECSSEHDVALLYLVDGKRVIGYARRSDIKKNVQDIDKPKVIIPKAGGTGNDSQVLGKAEVIGAPSVCSQTFLYAAFEHISEANAFSIYLKTKFLRALVKAIKYTQDSLSGVYRFVPLQDFTDKSDIDWSQSVADIDRQLYAKYGLTQEEITFIESIIKPM